MIVTILLVVDVHDDSGTVRLSVEIQPCQRLRVRLGAASDELHYPAIVDVGTDKLDVGHKRSEVAHVAKSHVSEEGE